REELTRARPEVEPRRVVPVDRHRRAEHAEMRVLLGQAARELLPLLATVARAPDCRLPVRHAARVPWIEGDDVERVAVVRVHRGREAELARQPVGDLEPRLAAIVAAMDADVVLLIHARGIGERAHEPVHAETDLLVRTGPVGAETLVPRRPRLAAVTRLEAADALHDRPEPRVVVAVEHQGRDTEMPGRLVRRVVPELAARLAGEGGEE